MTLIAIAVLATFSMALWACLEASGVNRYVQSFDELEGMHFDA